MVPGWIGWICPCSCPVYTARRIRPNTSRVDSCPRELSFYKDRSSLALSISISFWANLRTILSLILSWARYPFCYGPKGGVADRCDRKVIAIAFFVFIKLGNLGRSEQPNGRWHHAFRKGIFSAIVLPRDQTRRAHMGSWMSTASFLLISYRDWQVLSYTSREQ